jgi:hypothetical protein
MFKNYNFGFFGENKQFIPPLDYLYTYKVTLTILIYTGCHENKPDISLNPSVKKETKYFDHIIFILFV